MTTLHLPIIGASQPDPIGGAGQPVPGMPLPVDTFVTLWLGHPEQRRRAVVQDARLTAAAQYHANELCYRDTILHEPHGYDAHRGLDGSWANERAIRAGYPLPYAPQANNIESVAVTHQGPQAVLDMLIASPRHHDHLLGWNGFEGQTVVGVGYCPPAFWVILSAPEVGD